MDRKLVTRPALGALFAALLLAGCVVDDLDGSAAKPITLVVPYVGQGSGALLLLEGQTIAFDAGPESSAVLRDELRREHRPAIDLLVVSHWDLDHVGGIDTLVADGMVRRILYGAEPAESWMAARKASWCRRIPSGCERVGTPSRRALASGVELEFGEVDTSAATDNERTMVARVVSTTGRGLLLAPGDLDTVGEARLLASRTPLQASVLLVGHHGSRSSSSLPFLGAVSPRIAIVQAGAGNRYGHPHVEALERLRRIVASVRWVAPQTEERLDLGADPEMPDAP